MSPTLARLVLPAMLALVLCSVPVLSASAFEPVVNPQLETARASGDIRVDGKLDEAAWSSAARAGNFVERFPGDNLEPQVQTEALVTYDDENLYVGFICRDDPERIRATMSQRDQYGNDDEVVLCLDTYGDAAWAYEFCVNPYGVQKDMLWTKTHGEDAGFDLVWESAAHVNDAGYTVEMAIPFTSLRFPNQDVQTWRVDFQRNHPRESYRVYSWSANTHDEQCWPCQWGTVNGILGVRPGKGLEILPSFVSTQAGEMAGLRRTVHLADRSGHHVLQRRRARAGVDRRQVLGQLRRHPRGDLQPRLQPDRGRCRPGGRELHDLAHVSGEAPVLPGGERSLHHPVQLVLHPDGERSEHGGEGHRALERLQPGLHRGPRRALPLLDPGRGARVDAGDRRQHGQRRARSRQRRQRLHVGLSGVAAILRPRRHGNDLLRRRRTPPEPQLQRGRSGDHQSHPRAEEHRGDPPGPRSTTGSTR